MKKFSLFVSAIVFLCAFCACFSLFGCEKQSRLTEYFIECEINGDFIITGTERVSFYNDTENSFKTLKFNLFANAFREGAKYSPVNPQYNYLAYPDGKDYGGIEINSVYGEEELPFSVGGEDKNVLEVELPQEVFPEERAEITLNYTLKVANVVARTGYNGKTVNLANFYPVLCGIDENGFYECVYYDTGDPYFSDCANYSVIFSAPAKYTVAHSGGTIRESEENGVRRYEFYLKSARSFCMVMSENFEIMTQTVNGVEINYYYYDDQNPITSFEYAVKSLSLFGELFGEYAYDVYSVVETPFVQGGMEFPTLVMISDSVGKESYGEVIVHETAHQWWQTAVGNNEIEYGFLDEGLAEYSTVLFYERYPEYSLTRKQMIKSSETSYKIFCTVYDKLFKKVDTRMIRPLKDFTSEYEYVHIAYVKSCVMYDIFRETVGEEKFFNGLKTYYGDFKYKNAAPYDMVNCFIKAGADAEGFFDGFFNGRAII